MSSRLTSMMRTPISERIKVFDASSSPKKTPPRTPSRPRDTVTTPSVDLKPTTRNQHEREVSKPPGTKDQLRRTEPNKMTRPDPHKGTRTEAQKPRVTRTDSAKTTPALTQAKKAATATNSPRVTKKPVTAQISGGSTSSKTKTSPQNSSSSSSSSSKSHSQVSRTGSLKTVSSSKTITKRSSVTSLDVKPDVIPNVPPLGEVVEAESDSIPRVEIIELPPTEDNAKEQVTMKLIQDIKEDEEAITAEFAREDDSSEKCQDEMEEMQDELSSRKTSILLTEMGGDIRKQSMTETISEEQDYIIKNENVEEVDNENEVTKSRMDKLEINTSNKEMGTESSATDTRKSSIKDMEPETTYTRNQTIKDLECEVGNMRNISKTNLDTDFNPYSSKSMEIETSYLRKPGKKELDTEKTYLRKTSIKNLDTEKGMYLHNSSVKKGLEELEELSDNQYFTKQALNNVNTTSINQAMKLDIEYKSDQILRLGREMSELEGRGAGEEEVARLKKQKTDLENRLREQEEELDDLAGQVQQLEANKVKLEADLTQVKKEHRRELQVKEDELEDVRAASGKKVKVLEQQLEQEHEERINFLRERHDLEGKIMNLQDLLDRSGDEEQVAKLKKDLKKTKALLKDAQMMIEKSQNEGTNKVIMRQLKNQLEDAEFARTAAMKARQNAELELADVQVQLEDCSRSKTDLDEKNLRLTRERADLASQLQENEEELQDVMRKYKASVSAVTTDQITIQDQAATIQNLEAERNKLREQCAEINQRLDHMAGDNVSTSQHKRLELKIRELESKLELEKTTKQRLETQIVRQKEITEKMSKDIEELRMKESNGVEEQKKLSRALRDTKEELATLRGKEMEVTQKKVDLEKQLEVAEAETSSVRTDLKTALKRVEDLQSAINGEIDSDNSDGDSDSSDEEMSVFMDHHRRAMSVQRERESQMRELRASQTREIRSMSRDPTRDVRDIRSMSRDIRASVAREFETATKDLPGAGPAPRTGLDTTSNGAFNAIAEEE